MYYCSKGHSFAQNLKKMENLVEKSTLRAMMLDILLKDKELSKEIFDALVKENPEFVATRPHTYVSEPTLTYASEPAVAYAAAAKSSPVKETENISDDEFNYWINKHFTEYDAVFKALA